MSRISKLRDNRSLRRRPGQKSPRSITLIVCEGETELNYFEAARIRYGLTTAEAILAENSAGSAPISVVECAEKKCREQGGYDKVFCVFDRDEHESFERARERIRSLANRKRKALPISEAISMPCFELWVLLHFERTDAPFNKCDDVLARVRILSPPYKKADADSSRQLMDLKDTAIGNAVWLETRATTNDYNPYTTVHHVLSHFETVANPEEGA